MRAMILDARHDAEHLAAAEPLALDRLADHHRIERHDEGAHRQPIDRRRGDQAHLAHAGQRQLQRARDRRRGQRQHVHVGLAAAFSRSLCATPKCCSSSTTSRPSAEKLSDLRQQRVGADDDVDAAVGDAACLTSAACFAGDHARELRDRAPAGRRSAPRRCGNAGAPAAWSAPPPRPGCRPSRRRRRRAAPPRSCRSRHRRRSAGPSAGPEARSSSTSAMARAWSSVSANGKRAQNSSQAAFRRRHRSRRRASGAPRRCGSARPPCRGCGSSSAPCAICQAAPPSLSSATPCCSLP